MSRSIVRIEGKSNERRQGNGRGAAVEGVQGLNSRVELIQALIPLGLGAVSDVLQQEVTELAGDGEAQARTMLERIPASFFLLFNSFDGELLGKWDACHPV